MKVDAAIENDIVQITIYGSVVGIRSLNDSLMCKEGFYLPTHCYQDKKSHISNDGELVFENEETGDKIPSIISSVSELSFRVNPLSVELTTLSYIPKCKIVKYMGNLTFPFIREVRMIFLKTNQIKKNLLSNFFIIFHYRKLH